MPLPRVPVIVERTQDIETLYFFNDYDGLVYENVRVWATPYIVHAEARVIRGTDVGRVSWRIRRNRECEESTQVAPGWWRKCRRQKEHDGPHSYAPRGAA